MRIFFLILFLNLSLNPLYAFSQNNRSDLEIQTITINDTRLEVEIARSLEERSLGLQNRKELAPNRGMLFDFITERKVSFWMKNTLIPLSIAFIDEDGIITQIEDMEALSLDRHKSAEDVRYALEVNQGWFKTNGIIVGDRMEFH